MSTSVKLGRDPSGKSVNSTLYRSMIGSLLYFTANRLDIAFSVSVVQGSRLILRNPT